MLHKRRVSARCTVDLMTDWPAEWRPVNPKEAREYLDAHEGGSGDPELVEECQTLLDLDRRQPPTGPAGQTIEEWDLPEPPTDLLEEEGAD
jgi:hypothetical protein